MRLARAQHLLIRSINVLNLFFCTSCSDSYLETTSVQQALLNTSQAPAAFQALGYTVDKAGKSLLSGSLFSSGGDAQTDPQNNIKVNVR